jgi:catechol 2,3-dioxygenase-like lactoylglutathione lyase family enzyme
MVKMNIQSGPRRKENTVQQMNITQLGRVIIPVSDQDKALEFYTGKLGFEVRADSPFGDGNRWLEVAPAGSSASVALMPPRPGETPHNDQAFLVFSSKDLDADLAALRERGVDADDPMGGEGSVPRMFFFRDPDGNNLLEVEERES